MWDVERWKDSERISRKGRKECWGIGGEIRKEWEEVKVLKELSPHFRRAGKYNCTHTGKVGENRGKEGSG